MTAALKLHRPKTSAANVVDALGKVKAEIATLEEQEVRLRQQLVEFGLPRAEGKLFAATVAVADHTTVDRKAVIESLPQTDKLLKLLKKHTKVEVRTTVKVTSR